MPSAFCRISLVFLFLFSSFNWAQEVGQLTHPFFATDGGKFESWHNPSVISDNKGFTFGAHTFSNEFVYSHFISPFFLGTQISLSRVGVSIPYPDYGSITSWAIARKFDSVGKFHSLSVGLNLKMDEYSDFLLIDPGVTAGLKKNRIKLGLYTFGMLGQTPTDDESGTTYVSSSGIQYFDRYTAGSNANLRLNQSVVTQFYYTLPGELFTVHTALRVLGDQGERHGPLKHFYTSNYIGLTITPAPWARFYYKLNQFGTSMFEFSQGWDFSRTINRFEYAVSGYRYDGRNFRVATRFNLSLFGNQKKGPHTSKPSGYNAYVRKKAGSKTPVTTEGDTVPVVVLTQEEWEKNLAAYNRERIGFFRGNVIPYVNTFGYFTTLLVPPGVTNIAVGNYRTGFELLLGSVALLVAGGFIQDGDLLLSTFLIGGITLKLGDFILARNYVKAKNQRLKEKYKLVFIPSKNALKVAGKIDF